jgi:SH3 domain-containing YSC84-like protein 1
MHRMVSGLAGLCSNRSARRGQNEAAMIRKRNLPSLVLATVLAPPLIAGNRAGAQPAAPRRSDQQILVDKGVEVIATMRGDSGFASRDMLRRARAVMIVPELTKGGFILGGQGGAALLLGRLPGGGWSFPAFYSIGGGTLGLQIGVQQSQMVFFIISERGLQAWMRDQVKFGGQDGIAVFIQGQGAGQNAMAQNRADAVVWARAVGAYAGITVEGTSVSFNRDDTARYYGQPLTAEEVLQRGLGQNPGANQLRNALMAGGRG